MGFSAVPSPMKMRMKSAIGLPTADAAGVATTALVAAPISGSAGSPLLVAASGVTAAAVLPNSRRLNASAVHISGAAAGVPPLVPLCSHDNRPPPKPDTDELHDAGWAAVIAGATAAGASLTTEAPAAGAPTTSTTEAAGTAAPGAGDVPNGAGADGVPGIRSEPVRPPTGSPPVAEAAARWRWREVFPESVGPPESTGPTLAADSSTPPGSRPPDPSRPSAESAPAEPDAGRPAPGTRPRTGRDGPPDPDEAAIEGRLAEEDRGVEDRGVEDADDEPEASEPAEPVDPPEPVVSANATGTDATAEPTPNATANAPTRPTHRA